MKLKPLALVYRNQTNAALGSRAATLGHDGDRSWPVGRRPLLFLEQREGEKKKTNPTVSEVSADSPSNCESPLVHPCADCRNAAHSAFFQTRASPKCAHRDSRRRSLAVD